jgi:hypothetical protein
MTQATPVALASRQPAIFISHSPLEEFTAHLWKSPPLEERYRRPKLIGADEGGERAFG